MSAPWIILLLVTAVATGLLLWLAWRWLAKSWEVLDDDQLSDRLSGQTQDQAPASSWLRFRGWFTSGPRRLTYRRDERGRFRKIRR
jgi:hypothetical protein